MSGSEDKYGGFRRGAGAGSGGREGSRGDNRGGGPRREQNNSGGRGGFNGRGGGGQGRKQGGYRDDRAGKPRRDGEARGHGGERRWSRPNEEHGSRKSGRQDGRSDRRDDGPRRERRDFDDRRSSKPGSNRRGDQRSHGNDRRNHGDRPQRDDRRQHRNQDGRGKPRFERDDRRRGDNRDKPRYDDRKRDRDKPRFDDRKPGEKGRPDRSGGDRPEQRGDRQPARAKAEQDRGDDEPKTENTAPELPEDVDPSELHGEIRREMRSLPKGLADKIAKHLVAAGKLMDTDPERALVHARYARHRASRIAPVREANGLTAYQVGEWSEALSELRAARRMSGGAGHLAIMADCERALGRPERAIELSRSPEAATLEGQEAVELRIVAAGARRDCGEVEASVVGLQTPDLDPKQQQPWSARLFYAYADNLLAADRVQEAFTWFVHAAHADDEGETDAPERLDELVVRLGGPELAQDLVDEVEEALPEQPVDMSDPDRGHEAQ